MCSLDIVGDLHARTVSCFPIRPFSFNDKPVRTELLAAQPALHVVPGQPPGPTNALEFKSMPTTQQ